MEALEFATHDKKRDGMADALYWLGNVFVCQCKYAQAQESYAQARDMHARMGDNQGLANALQGLGGVCRRQCKLTKAEESFTLAQNI